MKVWNVVAIGLLVVAVACISGCATTGRCPENAVELDRWLADVAFPEITEKLRNSRALKGRRYLAVRRDREKISSQMDGLTEDVLDRLLSELRKHEGIEVFFRHPQPEWGGEYRPNRQNCQYFQAYDTFLTLSVRQFDESRKDLVRVRFSLYDFETEKPMSGLSAAADRVWLNPNQRKLLAKTFPNPSLKGMRFNPYSADEFDGMAQDMALRLTCKYQHEYSGHRIRIGYLHEGSSRCETRNFQDFFRNYINDYGEIQLVEFDRGVGAEIDANWILKLDMLQVKDDLCQAWAKLVDAKTGLVVMGIDAKTYFWNEGAGPSKFQGSWDIRNGGPSGPLWAKLAIIASDDGEHRATLFDKDHFEIGRNFLEIDQDRLYLEIYHDHEFQNRMKRTIIIEGAMNGKGDRITAVVSSSPPDDVGVRDGKLFLVRSN